MPELWGRGNRRSGIVGADIIRPKKSFIHFLIICAPEDIISRDLVKISENEEMFDRDSLKSALISGVNGLARVEQGGNLGLIHIHIFSEVS